MTDYLLLMHNDSLHESSGDEWDAYFAQLSRNGYFRGGSSIGAGGSYRKVGDAGQLASNLVGYIRIEARSFEEARNTLIGNPVYEASGTVEIRELPRDDV